MTITVGCDPEFLVKNGNDYTDFRIETRNVHGHIGSDHGGRVGELRPTHGTPAEVVANIRHQMEYIKLKAPELTIIAGGGRPSAGGYSRESIGGHIHFGGVRLKMEYDSCTRTFFGNRRRYGRSSIQPTCPDNKLVLALDYYIGRRLQKVPGGKRPKGSSYGRCSDIETKTWTGGGFEYRTPPSWLTDPYLAESVLAIGKRIVEMWDTKPVVFDHLFTTNSTKGIARRRDYDFLIPSTGGDRRYMIEKIRHFKRVAFSKTYKLDNPDCIDLWLDARKVQAIYEPRSLPAASTLATATVRAPRGSNAIVLQVCQLKTIDRSSDAEQEVVTGVIQFAIPEVRVYPFQEYTPWQFQLTNDVRLRPDTIYFSKELRPYLKIKRGGDFRNRFIEIKQRRTDMSGRPSVVDLTNCVFYNAVRSKTTIKSRIVEIFNTCARKKLRSSDMENGRGPNEADDD
jgi:hypothetical protein